MKRRSFVTGATVAAAGLALVSQRSDAATTSNSGRYVNVMDFGAVGDGVHDDTAAIQAAVSSLAANGGGVYFPPGSYAVSSPINPVANMAISGFGTAATKILPKTTGMRLFECNAGSAQMVNISISNLEIDAGSVTGVTGIYFTFCYNVAIQNITFSGCDYTVQLDRCRYVELNNCISRGGANRAGTLKLFSGSVTDYIHEVKIR
jgi:polygalacturonase